MNQRSHWCRKVGLESGVSDAGRCWADAVTAPRMLEWRNWQTHWTQNPAPFTGHEGSTPSSSTMLPALAVKLPGKEKGLTATRTYLPSWSLRQPAIRSGSHPLKAHSSLCAKRAPGRQRIRPLWRKGSMSSAASHHVVWARYQPRRTSEEANPSVYRLKAAEDGLSRNVPGRSWTSTPTSFLTCHPRQRSHRSDRGGATTPCHRRGHLHPAPWAPRPAGDRRPGTSRGPAQMTSTCGRFCRFRP